MASTNESKYGNKIYPNFALVLPNEAFNTPIRDGADEDGNPIKISIADYFSLTAGNRKVNPLAGGTHSWGNFEMDEEDLFANKALIESSGLVYSKDFTLDLPNVAYQLSYGQLKEFLATSPLNKGATDEKGNYILDENGDKIIIDQKLTRGLY